MLTSQQQQQQHGLFLPLCAAVCALAARNKSSTEFMSFHLRGNSDADNAPMVSSAFVMITGREGHHDDDEAQSAARNYIDNRTP